MASVQKLLEEKGGTVLSIGPDDSVFDAIKSMAENGVGALVVLEEGKMVGIISERDYAHKVILKGRASKETPVRDIMTTEVFCARADHGIDECMVMMSEKRIRHLPVVAGETVVGMISIGDLVKTIIAEQKYTIEQLESYIYG
jgi:CBS domain-containing protein